MPKQEEAKLVELQKRLEQQFAQGVRMEPTEGPHLQKLRNIAANLGLSFWDGKIDFVWRMANGACGVEFRVLDAIYTSFWPQWAFDEAKTAMLYGKRLTLFAEGEPIGPNLVGAWTWP